MKFNLKKMTVALLICGAFGIALPKTFVHAASADSPRNVSTSFDDYSAIRAVIGLYIQAGKEAKSDIMKPAFHKDAIIFGTAGKEVTGGPIKGLFDYIDQNPKATNLEAEITTIDIANNIAHVRVESNNWNGARYSDMFLLLKDKNEWKIITKIYYDHK